MKKKRKKKTSESDREDEVKGTPDKPESDSDKPEIPKKRPSRKESGGCDTLHHRTTFTSRQFMSSHHAGTFNVFCLQLVTALLPGTKQTKKDKPAAATKSKSKKKAP